MSFRRDCVVKSLRLLEELGTYRSKRTVCSACIVIAVPPILNTGTYSNQSLETNEWTTHGIAADTCYDIEKNYCSRGLFASSSRFGGELACAESSFFLSSVMYSFCWNIQEFDKASAHDRAYISG